MTHRIITDNFLGWYDCSMTSSPYYMDIHMTFSTPFPPKYTCIKLACRFTQMQFFWHFNSLPNSSPNSQVFHLNPPPLKEGSISQFHLTCSPLLSTVYYQSKQLLLSIILLDTVSQDLFEYLSSI